MGALGIVVAFIWLKTIYSPKNIRVSTKLSLNISEAGGA
jgi:ACS family glucarate transporter-like MFS transporter